MRLLPGLFAARLLSVRPFVVPPSPPVTVGPSTVRSVGLMVIGVVGAMLFADASLALTYLLLAQVDERGWVFCVVVGFPCDTKLCFSECMTIVKLISGYLEY